MSDRESGDNDIPTHPLERLKSNAEKSSERREKEVVRCPECGTEVLKESFDDAVETAINHDENRHDGEGVTQINGMTVPSDDVAAAAEDALDYLNTDTERA